MATDNPKHQTTLRRDVSELKVLLSDLKEHQLEANSNLKAELNVFRYWKRRLPLLSRQVKVLSERCKEQKIELKVLNRLFGKRMRNIRCECGKRMSLMGSEEDSSSDEETPPPLPSAVPPQPTTSQTIQTDAVVTSDSEIQTTSETNFTQTVSQTVQTNHITACIAETQTEQTNFRDTKCQTIVEMSSIHIQTEEGVAAVLVACEEENPVEKRSVFVYSETLTELIGKPLKGLWSLSGPLMSLNDCGECQFDPATQWADFMNESFSFHRSFTEVDQYWRSIAAGCHDCLISSKLILLPQNLCEMIVWIGINSINKEKFQIRLFSPRVDLNLRIKLPRLIKMQVMIDLLNGDRYVSSIHPFEVKKMGEAAESAGEDLFIPLKNLNPMKLPRIYLKFVE